MKFYYKVIVNEEDMVATTDWKEAKFYQDVYNEIYGKENVRFEMWDYIV